MYHLIARFVELTHGNNCRIVCDQAVPVISECLAGDFLCKLSDGVHQLPTGVSEFINLLETSTGYPLYILGPVTFAALAGTQWGLNCYRNHIADTFETNLRTLIKAKFGDQGDVAYELLQPIIREHLTSLLTSFNEKFGTVPQQAFTSFKRCLREDTTLILQTILNDHEDQIKNLIEEKETASPKPEAKNEATRARHERNKERKTDLNQLFAEYHQKQKDRQKLKAKG